jgi:DnaJ domain
MGFLLFGLLFLIGGLWALDRFMRANPVVLAGRLKMFAGLAALAVAVLLLTRGLGALAIPLASLGLWLLGMHLGFGGWPGSAPKAPGQSSRITTDHLDMEIDHDTGAMEGRVLKGMFQGRSIGSLKPVELAHLWADCRFVDPQSARVVEAYLDRIHPTWREDMARGEAEMASGPDGRMLKDEAYEILGLAPGARPDDIRTAHRELMKKMHPDRGGSTYLASKINEAKDVLLGG